MAVLVIIAFIATGAFYTHAKRLGLNAFRAAILPFAVLGALFLMTIALGSLFTILLPKIGTSETATWLIMRGLDAFFVLTYLLFIRKNWLAIQPADEPDDSTK